MPKADEQTMYWVTEAIKVVDPRELNLSNEEEHAEYASEQHQIARNNISQTVRRNSNSKEVVRQTKALLERIHTPIGRDNEI